MKRYLVFSGASYYAGGGWLDFGEAFDTLDQAIEYGQHCLKHDFHDWYHIIDTNTGKIVNQVEGTHCGKLDRGQEDLLDDSLKNPKIE